LGFTAPALRFGPADAAHTAASSSLGELVTIDAMRLACVNPER
jgi:hypothetical protein